MSQDSELDLSDVDADILLVTDYFGGELSPAEMARVEERVLDDDAFFAKVGLLIEVTLLQSSIAHRAMRAVLAERKARAEDSLALRVAGSLRPNIDELLAEPLPSRTSTKPKRRSVTAIGPRANAGDDPWTRGDSEPRWRTYARTTWRGVERAAVAGLVVSIIINYSQAAKLASIAARLAAGQLPTATLPTCTVPTATPPSATPPAATASTATPPSTTPRTARPPAATPPAVTPPSDVPLYGIVVSVPAGSAPRVVDMSRDVRATVMPGSRLSFDTLRTVVKVSLDGEASFHIPGRITHLAVFIPGGSALLGNGDFAMRSSGGSETLITVSSGRAIVIRDDAPAGEFLDVKSGFIRVTRGEKPVVVTQGTENFPRVPSP